MQKVHTHRFNGRKYTISVDEPYDGICAPPKRPKKHKPYIDIPDGLPHGNQRRARLGLITLLHECMHAECWKMSEKQVDQIARDIGRLLWRLGYRRMKR